MKLEHKNMLLMALFPYADKKHRVALRKLADEKGINWNRKDISQILYNHMSATILHKCTHYDSCVKHVGKKKARFLCMRNGQSDYERI